jgi:16S rRNA (cytosine1402-N4)-methyltransferase
LQEFQHETVLLEATVDALLPHDGGTYVDCTLGGGGHSERLLLQSSPSGQLIALDQDMTALQHAREKLMAYEGRFTLVHANFRDIQNVLATHEQVSVDGVLFDLGVSSPQFDEAERGFSYRLEANLDMRMDKSRGETAAHMVNTAEEADLAKVFFQYGEEKFSRAIARAIVKRRSVEPIVTTTELAEIVKYAIPAPARRNGPHPARRVFQALRIAVNDELGALEEALDGAFAVLKPGGRIAVITFHSLEDRIVKRAFVEKSKGCICPPNMPICQCHRTPKAKVVTRKPIYPTDAEVEMNPRARSAKLRVLEKIQ